MNNFEKYLTRVVNGSTRVILLDMAPPTHLFLKSYKYTNRDIVVESTYSLSEAMSFSNEPSDTLIKCLLESIDSKYETYNPMVVDIKETYQIVKLHGDVEKFFYYDKI